MFCENCGKQLIRGYSFCIECGSPVPPEVLEEGGLPGRSGEASENLPENAEKTTESAKENGKDVQSSMPGIQPIGSNGDEGTLVFCPNCGMRMQHNLDFCEKCGMKISDKPTNSVPLINNNPMGLDGSYEAFGGGIGDIFDNGANQFDNFIGGGMPSAFDNAEETQNLFGGNSYSANDMAILNQQISSFGSSASEMPEISKSAGNVRQQEPKDGETRKVENFSMSDVSGEEIPVSDGAVPVIEGCSMEEDHSADVSLDPYTFLGNSMDEPGTPSVEAVSIEVPAVESVAVAVEPVEVAEEVVEEPAAVEPVAVAVEPVEVAEEVVEEPAAAEPVAVAVEEPVEVAEEVVEEPAAVEPVAVAEEVIEEPAVEENEKEVEPMAEEPAKETAETDFDDFVPEEMGFIAETAPVAEETQKIDTPAATDSRQPVEDFDFRRPQRPQNNAPEQNPDEEAPKGNLVYCRTCGQDMYDTEKFCKNCGATYKGAYVPPKAAPSRGDTKTPVLVFGKIPLSGFVGMTAGILGAVVAILLLIQPWNFKNPPPIGGESQSTSSSVITPIESNTSSDSSTSSSSSDNSAVVSSSSSSSESSVSSSESTSATTSSSSSSQSSSSKSSSSSSKSSSNSKSSSSSSSNPAVTTDTKLKSLEQDREKIMYAAELIMGETAKMEAFSQHVVYAMNTSSQSNAEAIQTFYRSKFATNMISNLSAGKSTIERAISSASPKNSEFSSIYTSLKSLKTRYDSYYDYITSPNGGYSSFTKNCQSYNTMVNSAFSTINIGKFTGSYTTDYKNIAYAGMISSSVNATRNCISQLTLLQAQIGNVDSFERKAFSTMSSDVTAYASSISYAARAKAYSTMLKGASNKYSSAAGYIDSAYNSISSFLKICTSLPKTSAADFNSNINATIVTAKSCANSAAKVIS